MVEYGDFECPYCGQAEPIVRELLADFGDVRYVFRHLPLNDVHPHAQLAAEGAEAADRQGKFWEMHDMLMEHQGALTARNLIQYAADLGLNTARFTDDLRKHAGAARVAEDVDSADLSVGVRHAHVLHQRQTPLRRLRHRHAVRGGPLRPGAGSHHDLRRLAPWAWSTRWASCCIPGGIATRPCSSCSPGPAAGR